MKETMRTSPPGYWREQSLNYTCQPAETGITIDGDRVVVLLGKYFRVKKNPGPEQLSDGVQAWLRGNTLQTNS